MTNIEKGLFVKLFNRGGYVLDFSTSEFDMFTMEHVGVALCQKYKMSKGRSLTSYVHDYPESGEVLLYALFEYYEKAYSNFSVETTINQNGNSYEEYGIKYGEIYHKCRNILDSYSKKIGPTLQTYTEVMATNVTDAFSSEYIDWQMQIMMSMQTVNPTEAIGKAKELIESCCKGICEEWNKAYDKDWGLSRLVNETMMVLQIHPKILPKDKPAMNIVKSILGSLQNISGNMAELRNQYGSGHGKSPNYKGLEERHAKLAVGSSLTLINYLWDSHLRLKNKTSLL